MMVVLQLQGKLGVCNLISMSFLYELWLISILSKEGICYSCFYLFSTVDRISNI